ncbi:hypothetical protein J6590_096844 [Homalodisca vitripennis]|nr:hypothetical protein J6590_096844 [Homalodisca vitripennis]
MDLGQIERCNCTNDTFLPICPTHSNLPSPHLGSLNINIIPVICGEAASKKAIRIIAKLNYRESCRDSFRELGLLTLPCLYMFRVILYCQSKCTLVRGRDFHQYETRARDNFRVHSHRLAVSQHLPHQVGVGLINKLPESVKNATNQIQFKTRLKCLLVSKAFYSLEEFMMSRWDI